MGIGVLFKESLMYYIYENVLDREMNYSIVVIPCAVWDGETLMRCFTQLTLKKNDIVFLIDENFHIEKLNNCCIPDIDLLECYNTRDLDEEWFYEAPIHSNKNANKAIADTLIKYVWGKCIPMGEDAIIQRGEILNPSGIKSVNEFLAEVKSRTTDVPQEAEIGVIVMNCDPFTLGHRYLVEYAACRVDFLYLFIVKENASFFSFQERYKTAEKAVKDLENVKVFPSGDFMISVQTFPSYFQKETYQNVYADACYDVEIFARYLCPGLNITARFIGEEPLDETTRIYNKVLHDTLENSGVKVYEIPRKTYDDNVISASKVRRYYQNNEWEKIKHIVPECTYQFLKQRKCNAFA